MMQLLIIKHEVVGLEHFNDSKAFLEYSNDMQNVYKNIEEKNLVKKRKVVIVFDDKIAHMRSNKKLQQIVVEIFIKERKLNISLVFITQSYSGVPKNVTVKFVL